MDLIAWSRSDSSLNQPNSSRRLFISTAVPWNDAHQRDPIAWLPAAFCSSRRNAPLRFLPEFISNDDRIWGNDVPRKKRSEEEHWQWGVFVSFFSFSEINISSIECRMWPSDGNSWNLSLYQPLYHIYNRGWSVRYGKVDAGPNWNNPMRWWCAYLLALSCCWCAEIYVYTINIFIFKIY